MTAIVLALLSAMSFATSTVVQHRAATTAEVAPGRAAPFRLFLRLLRTPAWLAGQCAAACGFTLHGLALRAGAVTLVQPVLSSGLVLTLALGALVDRRHPGRPLPGRRQWIAAAAAASGVALFLVSAAPAPGAHTGRPEVLLLATGIALGLLCGAWAWSRRPSAPHRALVLGVAAGCGFGMTGVLLKDVVHHAPTTWSGLWPLLLMVLIGGSSIVAMQSAYQAGALIESLPPLTVLEPVVAVTVAAAAYGESLAPGWLAHTGQLGGLLLLALAVRDLARRPLSDVGLKPPAATPVGL
jgi:drug/metabolite transporter (DMT)-like permease